MCSKWIGMLLHVASNFLQGQTTIFRTSSFPSPIYFMTGNEIMLTCWIPSEYTFQYWMHPSLLRISMSSGRYSIEKTQLSVNLKIFNSTESDNGSYTCYAKMDETNHSSSISIFYESSIEIFSTSVNATVKVGESYSFFCNATNTNFRQWIHERGSECPVALSNVTNDRVVITTEFELQLRNITFEDEGAYKCLLRNNLEKIYLINNLSVTDWLSLLPTSHYSEAKSISDGNNSSSEAPLHSLSSSLSLDLHLSTFSIDDTVNITTSHLIFDSAVSEGLTRSSLFLSATILLSIALLFVLFSTLSILIEVKRIFVTI